MGKKKIVASKKRNKKGSAQKPSLINNSFLVYTLIFIILFTINSYIYSYLRVGQGLFNLHELLFGALVADLLYISAFLVVMSLAIQIIWLKEADNNTFKVVGVYALLTSISYQNTDGIFGNLLAGTWKWNLYIMADFIFEIISFWIIFHTLKKVIQNKRIDKSK